MLYDKRDMRKWVKVSVKNDDKRITYIGFNTFKERENFSLYINQFANLIIINVYKKLVPRVDFYQNNSKGFFTLNGQELNIIDKYYETFLGVKDLKENDKNIIEKELKHEEVKKEYILEDITCRNENCSLCDRDNLKCDNDIVRANIAPCFGRNKVQKRRYDEECNSLSQLFYPKSKEVL